MGRRLAALAALGCIALGSWIAACGIDESGTLDTSDGSIQPDVIVDQLVKEANPEANPPPLTCEEAGTPLDTSCLGKPVPAGWQPIAIQLGVSVGCGDGGFVSTPLETNPQLPTGACACSGCGASGAWTCGASLKSGQVNNVDCMLSTFDAGASTCWTIAHSSCGLEVTRFGNPQCGGGQQNGTRDAATTPVTACTPQTCDTDFCAMGNQGFKLCVYAANVSDGGCPSDFPAAHVVGPSTTVTCDSCQQCALANPNAPCTGSVTAYSNSNCTGTNEGTTTTCTDVGVVYGSIFYDAGPVPVPNCGPTSGVTTGKVALDQPSTICCLQ